MGDIVKKAYLILAHRNSEQVYRLIERLDDNDSHFFLHIDKSASAGSFSQLKEFDGKISFIPPVTSSWGTFGLVQAVINGLEAIQSSKFQADYIFLLSGQDYPIKSNDQINAVLSANKGRNYLEHFALPNHAKWKPNGGLYRVKKYFFGFAPHKKYTARAANFFGNFLAFARRKEYRQMKPYAGSMWWTLTAKTADYILEFIKDNPGYVAYHQHTFAPDELFFHMILLNADDPELKESIVNDDTRFIKWAGREASHPEMLTNFDFEKIKISPALFARKFDATKDQSILDLIDKYCLS